MIFGDSNIIPYRMMLLKRMTKFCFSLSMTLEPSVVKGILERLLQTPPQQLVGSLTSMRLFSISSSSQMTLRCLCRQLTLLTPCASLLPHLPSLPFRRRTQIYFVIFAFRPSLVDSRTLDHSSSCSPLFVILGQLQLRRLLAQQFGHEKGACWPLYVSRTSRN